MAKTAYEDWLDVATREGHDFWVKNTRLAVRSDELEPYVQKFEEKVWNCNLKAWTEKANWIRHSATYGATSLSLLYTCGRVVMTLNKDGNYLTLQGVEEKVSTHTMIGNIVDLANMLDEVTTFWSLERLKTDDELTLI